MTKIFLKNLITQAWPDMRDSSKTAYVGNLAKLMRTLEIGFFELTSNEARDKMLKDQMENWKWVVSTAHFQFVTSCLNISAFREHRENSYMPSWWYVSCRKYEIKRIKQNLVKYWAPKLHHFNYDI